MVSMQGDQSASPLGGKQGTAMAEEEGGGGAHMLGSTNGGSAQVRLLGPTQHQDQRTTALGVQQAPTVYTTLIIGGEVLRVWPQRVMQQQQPAAAASAASAAGAVVAVGRKLPRGPSSCLAVSPIHRLRLLIAGA